MSSLMQSEVFFFISAVGFVLLWILVAIFLVYLIRATRALSRIAEMAERNIEHVGDMTKEMLDDVRESAVFGFLFKKKKRKSKAE